MNYKTYKNTRDAVWRILLDCGVTRLPVDLNCICRQLGVGVYRYKDIKGLPDTTLQAEGLLYFQDNMPVILYNQDKPAVRIRFTVAHELGHLILGHVASGEQGIVRREQWKIDDPIETAANQFAIRLLAPACVLWGLGADTPEEIVRWCGISLQAARLRAERMTMLYQRGKFLTSPLERRVYAQFLPFIREAQRIPEEV